MSDRVVLPGTGSPIHTKTLTGGDELPVSALATTDGTSVTLVSNSNPLPVAGAVTVSGVATAAAQATAQTSLDAIATSTAAAATDAHLQAFASANHADLAGILAKLSADPATQTTLAALASAAATEATLSAIRSLLGGGLPSALVGGRLPVDGSSVTQPISAASLPLPSGAATAAKQDTSNTSLASIDGKVAACNTGAVTVASSALPTGAATDASLTNGNLRGTVALSGSLPAFATTPTVNLGTLNGAATAANQSAANTSLASIDGKTPALGPVAVASAQPITMGLPLNGAAATWPIAGTIVKSGAGAFYYFEINNTSGGAIFLMVFDAAALPTTSDDVGQGLRWVSPSLNSNAQSTGNIGHSIYGIPFATKGIVVFSTSATNYQPVGSTSIKVVSLLYA